MSFCNRCKADPCCCRERLDWTQTPCHPLDFFWVSNLDENGVLIPAGPIEGWLPSATGYFFDVPANWCLWSLGVDYPTEDGVVQVGYNKRPLPVRAGVFFNLSTTEFPCPVSGPVRVFIKAGAVFGADPPVVIPVWFHALVAEIPRV